MESRKRSFVLSKHGHTAHASDNFRATYYKALGVPGRSEIQLRTEIEECLRGPLIDRQKLLSLVEQFGTPASCRAAVWKVLLCVLPEAVGAWEFTSEQNSSEYAVNEQCWRLCTSKDPNSLETRSPPSFPELLVFIKEKIQCTYLSSDMSRGMLQGTAAVFQEVLEGCSREEQFHCFASFVDVMCAHAGNPVFSVAVVEEKLQRLPELEQTMYRMISALRGASWRT